MSIAENYRRLREEIPDHVTIVLAAKTRTAAEVSEAIEAGATDVGHNYVQEAESMHDELGNLASRVRWHMIGHLQKNKINKVLPVVDTIQTVDSIVAAEAIDKRVEAAGKSTVDILIEINSGGEVSKSGLGADYDAVEQVARGVATLPHLRLCGLMTMGPFLDDPEDMRPYFRTTKGIFERLREKMIPRTNIQTLSMGMSDSYRVAIEEGGTMVRLGTIVFGPRSYA
ncbi:MAG: YggS family pyridoxal phosphate-dependent enzyme [Chitinivibrionales bacterium]|nr:YggS family pyridoxal phosphate-dependent enzyme [Chitinivibrionales bacterium]MBD3355726.1 YggS family pyridoxal phosphate-dependent enzyme [Chitinivibrionales bacterium]